ncbi:conserved hypothetical protein [Ricinus communis]|uniref:Reverse transcriptase zinc-binding domain-containing protein n=1 Tax=Ricinus communis TaxID=3988 RepID=B9RIB3_RICCO|nr:conserved hypothetical protein [Ricinus communis]
MYPEGLEHLVVDDLLKEGSTVWDEEKLESLLTEEECREVVRIPVGRRHMVDKRVWHYEKHERRSVASVSHRNDNMYWISIWQLKVPPKVRAFMWKCAHNALAIKINLVHKHCGNNGLCSNCGMQEEALEHLMFFCDRAKLIWFSCALSYRPK